MTNEITTTTPARTLEQDMTAEELALFNGSYSHWGNAQDAALRGAAYLDRVMPGWASQVKIMDLDLASSCSCVLGQIFSTEVRELRTRWVTEGEPEVIMLGNGPMEDPGDYLMDGFGFGIQVLGLKKANSEYASDGERSYLNAAYFFGFDHTRRYGYSELTQAWTELIAERAGVPA